ncbi:phosphate:H+ symporter [Penicillium chermesinum]|nr:phosphate:H+ symporter [Penicillium chermesinum]
MEMDTLHPRVGMATPDANANPIINEESTVREEEAFRNQLAQERAAALEKIDNAKFSFSHVRAVIVAGVGFFTDSYDIFAINLCVDMIGAAYWQNAGSNPGKLPSHSDTALKVATSGGTVLGQLFFGWLADLVGRKRMYGVELLIIIVATLAQALSSAGPSVSIVGVLVFWRVIMGVGIGGDYPLSSIITSEFASKNWRGAMMGAVFAMQGIGQFAAAVIALIVTAGFKESLETAKDVAHCSGACQLASDKMWRTVIGLGAVPACAALYYRLTIPETPRYTFDVAHDYMQAGQDIEAYMHGRREGHSDALTRVQVQINEHSRVPKASWRDFINYYKVWDNGKVLLGTAGSWFFLDVAFYGLGLNNSIILGAIGWTGGKNVCNPGYWMTVATVDKIGRKPIQMVGFIVLFIIFMTIGSAFHALKHSHNGLLALYVIAQFFFNFGPNATTFIVPGECFPTRYRSTSHGISAAAGKIGAIIAQCVFGPLVNHHAPKGATDSPLVESCYADLRGLHVLRDPDYVADSRD